MKYTLSKAFVVLTLVLLLAACKKNNHPTIKIFQVVDIDGNVYDTVQIGTQIWLKQNLQTTHYLDGSAIGEIEDSATWANIYNTNSRLPAWCYTAHAGFITGDSSTNHTYGKLYNWYAATDPRQICPIGWHVPSDSEWNVLSIYLGINAGGSMKSISLWGTPNIGATNLSGFTAVPAGSRWYYGEFWGMSGDSDFWLSTTWQNNNNFADYGWLGYEYSSCYTSYSQKENGYSIRCIKD